MEYIGILVVCAISFGLFYLLDKGFSRLFRNQRQHRSGLSVRLNKKFASFGLLLGAVGLAAVFAGLNGNGLFLGIGGAVVMLLGIALIVYYLTFGVFYDDEGFVLTTFGKRSTTYQYNQIAGQLLYVSGGNILIELHMKDGRSVGLQSAMTGVYSFLDSAFENWCRQTGLDPANCEFHDPDNSIWFPMMEEK